MRAVRTAGRMGARAFGAAIRAAARRRLGKAVTNAAPNVFESEKRYAEMGTEDESLSAFDSASEETLRYNDRRWPRFYRGQEDDEGQDDETVRARLDCRESLREPRARGRLRRGTLAPSLTPSRAVVDVGFGRASVAVLAERATAFLRPTGVALRRQQPTTTYSPPSSASRTAGGGRRSTARTRRRRATTVRTRRRPQASTTPLITARGSAPVNEDLDLQPGSRVDGVGLLRECRRGRRSPASGIARGRRRSLPRLRADESSTPDGDWTARALGGLDDVLGLRRRRTSARTNDRPRSSKALIGL